MTPSPTQLAALADATRESPLYWLALAAACVAGAALSALIPWGFA